MGLALRAGAPLYFPLPPTFYAILSNSPLAGGNTTSGVPSANFDVQLCAEVTQTLALSMRNGIISTFPEVRTVFGLHYAFCTVPTLLNSTNVIKANTNYFVTMHT